MSKIIEITRLRMLEMVLDMTHGCLIIKYAEETADGKAVQFGTAVFWEEFPEGKAPSKNWYLFDKNDAEKVHGVLGKLAGRLEEIILGV